MDARKFGKSNKRARGRGGRGNDGNLNGDSGAHMPQLDFYFSPRYAPPEKSFTIVSLVVNVPLLRMEQRFSTGLTHDSPENEREKIQLLNFPSVKAPLLFSYIYPRFSKCGIVKRSSKLFEKRI